jgi:hypothetical protein
MPPWNILLAISRKMNTCGNLCFRNFVNFVSDKNRLSSQLGLIYMHLSINSQSPEIRRDVNVSLVEATSKAPALTTRVVRDSLTTFLSRGTSLQKSPNEESSHKHSRLSAVLLASVSFGDEVDQLVRENAVVETVVLAHHHLMSSFAINSVY